MNIYDRFPQVTVAYAEDASKDRYFGEAPSGTKAGDARWQICKMAFTGAAWIMYFPVNPATNRASQAPIFVWTSATGTTYTYRELGT